ncbi:MAG: hypothetical protein ACRD2N_21640 [Vicinamibacterales bacterium]
MDRADTTAVQLTLAYAALATLLWGLSGYLDHDEHQFMASAYMVATNGVHPYKDFAYFHMPNLAYLYSLCFLTPYPFPLARLFVALCSFGISLIVLFYARSLLTHHSRVIGVIAPVCLTLLLAHSFLFRMASSHVWNHATPTLCAVISFILHRQGLLNAERGALFFWSGASMGMAVGIRLTFVPLIVPFLLAILLFSVHAGKGLTALTFLLGILAANLPAIVFLVISPQEFWFGNLGYPSLNTLYRGATGYSDAMTLPGKFRFLLTEILERPTEVLILLVAISGVILLALERIRHRERFPFDVVFVLLCLPFAAVGALAPTPSWVQYYFVIIPFLVLLAVQALSALRTVAFSEALVTVLAVAAIMSFVYGSPLMRGATFRALTKPQLLTAFEVQRQAQEIRRYIESAARNEGEILTLSPLYAILSGLPIYEEFVSGPFGWRVSRLVSETEATDRGLPPAGISSFVQARRPRAILTGQDEVELEKPITVSAQALGYQPLTMPSGVVVWLRRD